MEKDPWTYEKKLGKMIDIQPPLPPSDTVREVTEISHEKLPPMLKNQPSCSIIIFTQSQK